MTNKAISCCLLLFLASKTVSGSNKNFKVKERVNASGFLVSEDSVAVLSGTEEGVFSWFTLNVLLDRMKHIDEAKKGRCFKEQNIIIKSS